MAFRSLPFRFLRSLPFRIDRTIAALWGQPEHLLLLKGQVTRTRKIDALVVGSVRGLRRPILIDGLTRLLVHHELGNEGVHVPFEVETREYASYADAIEDVVNIQRARRNITEGQIALALLEAERVRRGGLPRRGRGRPKACAHAFPSAKALARRAGVGDWAVRVVSKAMTVNPSIVPLIREGTISLRTAERRLSSQNRDTNRTAQRRSTADRRNFIKGLKLLPAPGSVTPNGIYCGDAVEQMKRIDSGTVGLIATSIPYPCSVEYDLRRAFDGDYKLYLDELRGFISESKRLLRTGGRLAINFDLCARSANKEAGEQPGAVGNLYNLWMDLSVIAQQETGLLFYDWKSWYKQNCAGAFAAKGSTGSCRSPRGNFNVEPILVWSKDSTTLDGDAANDDIGHEYNKFVISDWYVRPARRLPPDHPDFHPCPWPEEIAYRLIKLYCFRGDVVLDPFNGGGTTTFVARALGRQFIGIDNSPLYCDAARRRLSALDGLDPDQMLTRIERFVPFDGERVDGRVSHRKIASDTPPSSDPAEAA